MRNSTMFVFLTAVPQLVGAEPCDDVCVEQRVQDAETRLVANLSQLTENIYLSSLYELFAEEMEAIRKLSQDSADEQRQLRSKLREAVAANKGWFESLDAGDQQLDLSIGPDTHYNDARKAFNIALSAIPPHVPLAREEYKTIQSVNNVMIVQVDIRNRGMLLLELAEIPPNFDPELKQTTSQIAAKAADEISLLQRSLDALQGLQQARSHAYFEFQQKWSSVVKSLLDESILGNPQDFVFDPNAFALRFDAMRTELRRLRSLLLKHRVDYLAPLTAKRYTVALKESLSKFENELLQLNLPDAARERYRFELNDGWRTHDIAKREYDAYDDARAQDYHAMRVDDIEYYMLTTANPDPDCVAAQSISKFPARSLDAERVYINFIDRGCL